MSHKSADARRHRRSRYRRAIDPIRTKYNCTAMQAADIVVAIDRRNGDLSREVERLKGELAHTEETVKELKAKLAAG